MPQFLARLFAATVTAMPLWWMPMAQAQVPEPGRTVNLLVYGEDACPEPESEDEIVVCARQPEGERYRIPRRFRDRGDRPLEVSWSARVADLEEAQRFTRPNSCSVVGSFGQTGCTQEMIRQWYRERRAMESERASQR